VRVADILSESMVIPDLCSDSKQGILQQLAEHLGAHPEVSQGTDAILSALLNRERLGSTGVGEGVAIPHAKIPGLAELVACFARAPKGVPYGSIDKKPVQLFFVLLVPENSAGTHLKALARVSRLLRDSGFRALLLKRGNQKDLYQAFLDEDAKH